MKQQNKVVLGLGMGDEGKGLVTNWLCLPSNSNNRKMVVRFSGGQQAGHTVYSGDLSHVFSNFGSGTLQGVPTIWLPTCTIDPIGILNELSVLHDKGIDPVLYIDTSCPVTTFYDKLYNRQRNEETGHGSVGVGVGATFEREENLYSLTFGDLFYNTVYRKKFNMIQSWYLSKGVWHIDDEKGSLSEINKFHESVQTLIKQERILPVDALQLIEEQTQKGTCFIYEGSQGLMLDPNIGYFPYVTRSRLLPDLTETDITDIYVVTRAYQTRHGNGPLSNEGMLHKIQTNPQETNVDGYQGTFRRSVLDLDTLRYALFKSGIYKIDNTAGNINLVITCLDHVKDDYRCTIYGTLYTFKTERDFITAISEALNITNIYVSHSPFSENVELFKWE